MKRFTKPLIAATLLAGGALLTVPVLAHGPGAAQGQSFGGWGMGAGMMNMMTGGGPMHPAMMGAWSGPCTDQTAAGALQSESDVKSLLGKRLEWMGNDRLKVGAVEKTGDDTWVAEIVTVDGSLVDKVEVNKSGFTHRVN